MSDVSSKRLAALIGVSTQRVARWIDLGMPASAPGKKGRPRLINVRQALDWLTQREIRKHIAPDGGESRAEVARRHMIARADLARARATAAENAVIDRDEAFALIRRMLAIVDEHMAVLPDTLADRVAHESNPAVIARMIFDEARLVRQLVSDDFRAAAAAEMDGDDV